MSSQQFSAAQREAIWLAHERKCAYTREPIDISDFHIDHIVPETLADDPDRLEEIRSELGLPPDFDLFGYGNLLPSKARANLQKGAMILDKARTNFFLGIASSKISDIESNLKRIERRKNRGKAIVLLQQCLERGELTPDEVSDLLLKHSEAPEEIFQLIESMQFADAEEIRFVAKSDLEVLRDRPVRLGQNDHIDGVTLTNDAKEERHVRTCREYDEALAQGYFAYTNFDIKMSTWFEHQCGLIKALQVAKAPTVSHIAEPKVSILDLDLLPFSLFPNFDDSADNLNPRTSYQDKVGDGTLTVMRLRQNLLQIQEPEGMGQQLIEVARADFNGDGIEDILLFEYCYATHGTLGFGGIRILTRTTPNGMLEEVARSDT